MRAITQQNKQDNLKSENLSADTDYSSECCGMKAGTGQDKGKKGVTKSDKEEAGKRRS
jgi:hypothetical protein